MKAVFSQIMVISFSLLVIACSSTTGDKLGQPQQISAANFREGIITEDDRFIEFYATVIENNALGGFYDLSVDDQRFDPVKLPAKFQRQGLKVQVRAMKRLWFSDRQGGRLIHIVSIEEVGTGIDQSSR